MGSDVYNVDAATVVARGVAYTEDEMSASLTERVGDILWDEAGRAELRDLLEGSANTEFEQQRLAEILEADPSLENWRVGEAFAEAYLVDERNCEFPWPGGRDLKSPSASPAGCDLVGFQKDDTSARMAFGEAKTSDQEQTPPSVVYGRHGLTGQLENLRDSTETKDHLVKYLGFHASGKIWLDTYKAAAKRFLANPEDVSLFGVLVRDIAPNEKDLRGRASALSSTCPASTSIELRALYFPVGSVEHFPQIALKARPGAA